MQNVPIYTERREASNAFQLRPVCRAGHRILASEVPDGPKQREGQRGSPFLLPSPTVLMAGKQLQTLTRVARLLWSGPGTDLLRDMLVARPRIGPLASNCQSPRFIALSCGDGLCWFLLRRTAGMTTHRGDLIKLGHTC